MEKLIRSGCLDEFTFGGGEGEEERDGFRECVMVRAWAIGEGGK